MALVPRMGLGLRMAIAARTATISTARMQIRTVWAIRISLVRQTIMVLRPRMAKELKTARELKTAQQLRMEIRVRTAITPTAHMGTRMDWATSMETRIKEGQMATVTAKAIADATAAAKTNLAA
jgi:hypothetical protein